MVQIIAGEKGKGKTKILLDKVNSDILTSKGTIVYLDKSNKHMYELNNKIRLINVNDYCIECASEFVGFICGIISQDHDLDKIYLDSFLKVACLSVDDIERVIAKLDTISVKFNVDIIISLSANAETLTESVRSKVIVAL
ncbi:MAG: twitching motility protein PilT [Lachnospiraceae bacterium]|nr:twitching motility protein PilT [Lachnospiraceae bacterium]